VSEPLARRLSCEARRNRLEPLRQHTGRTDLPLTTAGEQQSARPRAAAARSEFCQSIHQPVAAREADSRAGRVRRFGGNRSRLWPNGTTASMRAAVPPISSPNDRLVLVPRRRSGRRNSGQVAARADQVIRRVRAIGGNVVIFSSAHISRVLAARWLGLDAAGGRYFVLGTSKPQHSRLRAQSGRAGDPAVERDASAGVRSEQKDQLR